MRYNPSDDILAYLTEHKEATAFDIQYSLNTTIPKLRGNMTAHHIGMWLRTLHSQGKVECVGRTSANGNRVWRLAEVSE